MRKIIVAAPVATVATPRGCGLEASKSLVLAQLGASFHLAGHVDSLLGAAQRISACVTSPKSARYNPR
jgi:hypothetical protein